MIIITMSNNGQINNRIAIILSNVFDYYVPIIIISSIYKDKMSLILVINHIQYESISCTNTQHFNVIIFSNNHNSLIFVMKLWHFTLYSK